MNTSIDSGVFYMKDFARAPQTAATKRSTVSGTPFFDTTGQSLTLAELNWELPVWSRLKFLRSLNEGWDGTDSKPLDDFAAQFGMKLLQAYLPSDAPAPQLSLLRYGGLQFEWFNDNQEFELEIIGPYKVRAWFSDLRNDQIFEGSFDYNYSELSELFKKLMLNSNIEVHAATAA
jgi:hypothetical protein